MLSQVGILINQDLYCHRRQVGIQRLYRWFFDILPGDIPSLHQFFSNNLIGMPLACYFNKIDPFLTPYMQQRCLQAEILHWCKIGVQVAEVLRENPAWLFFLGGQTQYALGQWEEARMSFQAAIKAGEKEDVHTHARALLALGRLEFNQGNYRMAFEILNAAQGTSQDTDQQQMLTLLGETAAYYLNRREFEKALALYREVDRLQKQFGASESSDHTLLMFGVV
jgi:tetratricopeptide (TPR) repeat protein